MNCNTPSPVWEWRAKNEPETQSETQARLAAVSQGGLLSQCCLLPWILFEKGSAYSLCSGIWYPIHAHSRVLKSGFPAQLSLYKHL